VTGVEKGLLGIAIHPNFNSNHYVYVFYTAAGPVNRVVRFTATISNGDTVATSPTPEVIVDNLPAADAHNGGIINFGPDGMLYVFVGENEVAGDAQNLSSLRGKLMRFTPDGAIPSDNPFFNTLQAPYSAIYSYGHRNSFGFTFHPHTNDLWETENGDNDNDQINRIIAGANYGWPICTGICNDSRFIDPIITFTPTIAPTGIVAIREDSVYPAQYFNNLLFADFNIGQLHRIVLGGAGLTDFVSHSIVSTSGQGAVFGVMHGLNVPGQDGYVYVTTGSSIFRVVVNSP
jgi:glucose/arabinose dehydrogenase